MTGSNPKISGPILVNYPNTGRNQSIFLPVMSYFSVEQPSQPAVEICPCPNAAVTSLTSRKNQIMRKSIRCSVSPHQPILHLVQTTAPCPEPHRPVSILPYRHNIIMGQPVTFVDDGEPPWNEP